MPLRTNPSRFRALGPLLMLASMLLAGMTITVAHADNLTKLYSFSQNYASGKAPMSKLIQAPDGYFYGTTSSGGTTDCGTIFRMSKSGTVTTLHSFDIQTTGCGPLGGLFRDSDGAFYGATESSATYAGGIYKMTIAIIGGSPVATVTPYYVFKGYNTTNPALSEPANPYYGELIKGSDGKLYGTTNLGGVNNYGAVYSITIVSSGTPVVTVLHSFNSDSGGDGYNPYSGVTEGSDGKLYGTTYYGGSNGYGTVYSLGKDGANYTDIHDFGGTDSADGASPWSQLTKSSSGDLYGTTVYGGGANDGTLYKISSAGIYSRLYTFDGNAGQFPYSQPIIATDGNLYGTTRNGGSGIGAGVVYKYDLGANTISVFATFDGTDASSPNAITQGADKSFYGTSESGGLTYSQSNFYLGNGSAFKVSSTGRTSLLYSFYTHSGYTPIGRTVQGPDGHFYGTTSAGGYHDNGTIYKSDASGKVTILHHLNNTPLAFEGDSPQAGLIVGRDGSLYGSTTSGGRYSCGTIFKISTGGSFSVLYSLEQSQGSHIYAPLMQGEDGNFYGVASSGGANGYGTAFKLTGKTLTVLHHFANIDGQATSPQSGLAQDAIGNLYGTTLSGSTNGGGAIYELNTSGTSFNTVYIFGKEPRSKGANPSSALLYTSGTMYGTTTYGGANNFGTIYKFTPSVTAVKLTVLHDFDSATDGDSPAYTLALGPDGKFYGTTSNGGPNGGGVAYSLDKSNNFTNLYSFSNAVPTGAYRPSDGVIVGSDNNLYLTTRGGGDFGQGTFDTLDISLHFAVKVSASVSVTLGALTLKDGVYHGNLTVTNTGKTTILGPLNVVLTGLTGGTTLVNKTGDVPSGYGASTGKPYIQADPHGSAHGIFALGAGKSVTIPVQFSVGTGVSASSQTYLRRF